MSEKDNMYMENRDSLIGFKVTKSERKLIETHCNALGISMSRFIRHVVMNNVKDGGK